MTLPEYAADIKKYGFKPNHSSIVFDYPPRCYFFIEKNISLMKGLMFRPEKCDITRKGFNQVVLFILNGLRLKPVKFYSDPSYPKKHVAVYTYEHIRSSAIKQLKNLMF